MKNKNHRHNYGFLFLNVFMISWNIMPKKSLKKPADSIVIRGARTHNLKNIDVTIPRGTMTAITGLSGSGKSSLAFDTIFAEGQRRYVESPNSWLKKVPNVGTWNHHAMSLR
jgi:hypothetical protein